MKKGEDNSLDLVGLACAGILVLILIGTLVSYIFGMSALTALIIKG